MFRLGSILFVIAFFFFLSCKEKELPDCPDEVKENEVKINLLPKYQDEIIDFSTIYTTPEGYRIRFEKINVIGTNFTGDENYNIAQSGVYKFDVDPMTWYRGVADYLSINSISGNIGVPPEENHKDPAARPLSDPLNIMNTGDMHWGWDPGYIFLMIEGRADTTSTGEGALNSVFLYHVGMNDLLRTFEVNDLNWEQQNTYLHETTIIIDMEKVFDNVHYVDIKEEPTSHTDPGEEPLSTKIIENFVSALRPKL